VSGDRDRGRCDNILLRRLTEENEGYLAIQVGFGRAKESRVSKPLLGEFKKAGVEPLRFVREFRLRNDLPEGDVNLSVTQFQPGDFVDVIGRSKGKGFQGVMKKHNFHGQGRGARVEKRTGAIGAVGNRSTPGRIWKNQGMPGHMGDRRVTVAKSTGHAGARSGKDYFDKRCCARSERQVM